MSTLTAQARRRVTGSILLLTILFMVIISLFAIAFWNIIPFELHSARRFKDDTRAYFAADAGVVDCLSWLETETVAGNVDQHFADDGVYNADNDLAITRTGTIDDWQWTATLTPGPGTYGYHDTSSPNPIRVYKVDCIASHGTQKYRSVSAWVSQDSFGGKNWTVNDGAAGNTLWLNLATFKLGGDYHTNDKARINIPTAAFWSGTAPAAIGGKLTFSTAHTANTADNVEYNNWAAGMLPYNAGDGSSIPGRYEKITATGRLGVQLEDRLTLPANTDSVSFGTWGATPPAPNTLDTAGPLRAGAFFGVNGSGNRKSINARINGAALGDEARNGIYIEGDVDQIDLEVVGGNQRIRIDQGNKEIEVNYVTNTFNVPAGGTINGVANPSAASYAGTDNGGRGYTVIRNSGTNDYLVYKGQTNGAIFATGDINGVRGVTKGRRTIATLTDEGATRTNDREIRITGPLTYAGTTPGDTPATADDQLGLISYAIRLESTQAAAAPDATNNRDGEMWPNRNATSPTVPLYLYTSIFAGRNSDPQQSASDGLTNAGGFGSEGYSSTGIGAGHMKLFGSLTEGVRQAKGTFNSSTGAGSSGYSYSFFEDPNLKQVQPPFFPTLPHYNVITWEEKSVFAY